jgi:Zn-dependent M28 family amino/carboxypeptidase
MRIVAAVAGTAALLAFPAAAGAGPVEDSQQLRQGVTLPGTAEHMEKLQQIANAHQGNRAAGTVGYEQSVAYTARRLRDLGYDVQLSPFDFPTWRENSTPVLEMVTPTPTSYTPGGPGDDNSPTVDFITFEFSNSGDVTAPVVPTNDIVLPPAPTADTSNSGCEPEDFPAETDGAISLIQRGTCPFVQKLSNAADAGAAGVILFNEGQPGRTSAIFRGAEPYYPIPAVAASTDVGTDFFLAYQNAQSPTATLTVDAGTVPRVQHNVIADSPWGDPDNVVFLGGHLDSVPEGPGINDNGSGVAAILETAEELADLERESGQNIDYAQDDVDAAQRAVDQAKRKVQQARKKVDKAKSKKQKRKAKRKLRKAHRELKQARQALRAAEAALEGAEAQQFAPRQSLRIGFWGAEEAGLIGSSQYVDQLTAAERAKILLNLNFDMLGSPNFARYVYDGNTDSTPPPPGGSPPGSDVIEQVLLDYFASQGLPTQPTAFDGRSDYGPFIAQNIPAGGLFSGAEDPKTAEQVSLFGGVEGEQLDPCYHEVCDTYSSVFGIGPPGLPALAGNGATSLDQMADAVAHATHHFLTEFDPLGAAAAQAGTERDRAYRLPFRGSERTFQH